MEKSIPFLLLPVMTRVLTPEEFGELSVFLVMVSLYSIGLALGLPGFIRVIYQKTNSIEFLDYVRNIHTLVLSVCLVTFFFTVVLQEEIAKYIKLDAEWVFFAFFIGLMQYFISLRLYIYQTARKAKEFCKLQMSKPIVDLLFILILVLYMSGNIESRLVALILSVLITSLLSAYFLYKDGFLGFSYNRKYSARALNYSLPLLPHAFALVAVLLFDRIIISNSLGFESLGIFVIACTISSPSLIIADTVNRALMPWAFEKFRLKQDDRVVAVSYLVLSIMLVFCLVFSVALWFGYSVILDEKYQSGKIAATLLVWAGMIKLIYYLVAKGAVYAESVKFLPVISIVTGGGYLIVLFLSVQYLNISQLALLLLLYYASVALFTIYYSNKVYPQPWGFRRKYLFIVLNIINEHLTKLIESFRNIKENK